MASMASTSSSSLVLGIDLGTSCIKLTLVDQVSKNVIMSKDSQSNATTVTNSNFDEQNVTLILDVLKKTLTEFPQTFLSRVTRIGVCGQMHGCMFWKRTCLDCKEALSCCSKCSSSLITWQDQRCSRDFLDSLPSGNTNSLPTSTGFGCATIFWLARNDPDFLSQYDCAGTVQDFLVAKLCELDKPVMSTQNAASWGYCDVIDSTWDMEVLQSKWFPVHLLPDIQTTGQFAGELEKECHCIPKGTKVGLAYGDLQCSVLASTEVKSDAVLNIGTSSQLAVMISRDQLDQFKVDSSSVPVVQVWPFFKGEFVAVAASLTGGNIFSSFVDMLQSWMNELGITTSLDKKELYTNLLQCALSKDNTTLQIQPTIWGERHDNSLTGQVLQITPNNTSLGDVTLSLFQGIVRNLHSMLSKEQLVSCGVQRIVGTGSAITKNSLLQQETERVWELPLVIRTMSNASLGAALAIA